MNLTLNADWVIGVLLVGTRLAGLFLLLPVLGFGLVPARIQMLFVLGLTLIFAASPAGMPVHASTLAQLVLLVAVEFLKGALTAFSVNAAFAALNFAGHVLDFQIGLNAAAVFNFNTQAQDPLLSTLYSMLGGVLFLVFDAHHELLRGLAQSFQAQPVGDLHFGIDPHRLALQFGGVFLYGFMVASPIVLGLYLFDVTTAFLSRSMPQLNIYFVSLPLKISWGLLLLVASLQQVGPLVRAIFAHGGLSFGTGTA